MSDPYEDEDWGSDELRAEEEGARSLEEVDLVDLAVYEMMTDFRHHPIGASRKALSRVMGQLKITRSEAWQSIRSEALFRINDPVTRMILESMTAPP